MPSLPQIATGILALTAAVDGLPRGGASRRHTGGTHPAQHLRPRSASRRETAHATAATRATTTTTTTTTATAPDICRSDAKHAKVALMFLSRGALPHEPVWQAWFKAAEGLVPKREGLQGCEAPPKRPGACPPTLAADTIEAQDLFSVYVHTAPDYTFGTPSFFAKHQVAERVAASWGQHALIDAERALVRAALEEPRNMRFVLLSESGAPLYPPDTIYQQLIHEDKSRINACFFEGSDAWRWHPAMQRGNTSIGQTDWRKSSQWVTLTREHAQIFANDTAVDAVFREHCNSRQFDPELGQGFHCYSDEHYLPVLLGHAQVGHQTDCVGRVISADWSQGGASPRTYAPNEVNASLFVYLRGTTCQSKLAIDVAPHTFTLAAQQDTPTCGPAPAWDPRWLHAECPLFARKFAPASTAEITEVFTDCDNHLALTRC